MSSVVIVDDVSPVVRTVDVNRVWYCVCGVVGVPKTQHSILFLCSVGNEDGESKEELSIRIAYT